MLRFIFILISVFTVGFFIVKDTWMVTVQGFGYELKASVLILAVAVFLFLYLIHLLKKPFGWWGRCQNWLTKRHQNQKEAYLLLILKTVLDQDSLAAKQILKEKNKFFDKKSDENYLIEALFEPNPHVFEQLLHREKTELAGIKGLLSYAQEKGDLAEATRLLQKASEKYGAEPWVWESLWMVQTLQNDWHEAIGTLDILKKMGLVSREEYAHRRALLLLKLGRVREAYKLAPEDQAVALAYAKSEPTQAQKIIRHLWHEKPCWDAFHVYWQAISDEKPAKKAKLIEKLIHENPKHRLSLLIQVQVAMYQNLWAKAKGDLDSYLNIYPLTVGVAHKMAEIEQQGWHHTEEARKWEEKALTLPPDLDWCCTTCGYQTDSWSVVCPHCNTFGSIKGQ